MVNIFKKIFIDCFDLAAFRVASIEMGLLSVCSATGSSVNSIWESLLVEVFALELLFAVAKGLARAGSA